MWETLADGEGNLKEVLAAPDGVHFSAGNGYGAWVTYLRNHAKYSADNAWTPGSATQAEISKNTTANALDRRIQAFCCKNLKREFYRTDNL